MSGGGAGIQVMCGLWRMDPGIDLFGEKADHFQYGTVLVTASDKRDMFLSCLRL